MSKKTGNGKNKGSASRVPAQSPRTSSHSRFTKVVIMGMALLLIAGVLASAFTAIGSGQ